MRLDMQSASERAHGFSCPDVIGRAWMTRASAARAASRSALLPSRCASAASSSTRGSSSSRPVYTSANASAASSCAHKTVLSPKPYMCSSSRPAYTAQTPARPPPAQAMRHRIITQSPTP